MFIFWTVFSHGQAGKPADRQINWTTDKSEFHSFTFFLGADISTKNFNVNLLLPPAETITLAKWSIEIKRKRDYKKFNGDEIARMNIEWQNNTKI